jgi:hypothetical protein
MEDSDLEAVIPTLKLSFPSPKSRVTVFEIVIPEVGVRHAFNEVRKTNKGSVNSAFVFLVPEAGFGFLKWSFRYLVCANPKEGLVT